MKEAEDSNHAAKKVLVIDSTVSNALETIPEQEELEGCAQVTGIHVTDETEIPLQLLEETDAVIIWHQVKLTSYAISRLNKCRAIVRNGVGYDNIDIDAAGQAGIRVANVTDYGTEEVADHALALALAISRQIVPYNRQTGEGGWDWKIGEGKIRRLRGQVFGIIGLGRIGIAVAVRAKAFGFDVVFYDPYLPPGIEKSLGIRRARKQDELLAQANVISLHCPLTEETENMLSKPQFDLMQPGTVIVNTARGGVIRLADLQEAVRSGKVLGAGLDVVVGEPPKNPELFESEAILGTPHAAFYSVESFDECRRSAARIVRSLFEDNVLLNQVNQVK
ncbi:C-terminal binding protein [Paenibacillus piri]|uniref:C-terminal binding protein n=1 Tax=Paenibacillus piri TaxID=2547395 RepID=A0A4R5KG29_9BACL|nr:C-terminal binding protein [Paenibacillus piri]TDF93267.1 C-terminal binding protein [Paenibacillus piri]